MDGAGKLFRQDFVHPAVPFHPAQSGKGRRHDKDPKVGFPFRAMSGMTGMEVRFIDDPQALGGERGGKFLFNPGLDGQSAPSFPNVLRSAQFFLRA